MAKKKVAAAKKSKTPFKDFGFGGAVMPKKHFGKKGKVAAMKKKPKGS